MRNRRDAQGLCLPAVDSRQHASCSRTSCPWAPAAAAAEMPSPVPLGNWKGLKGSPRHAHSWWLLKTRGNPRWGAPEISLHLHPFPASLLLPLSPCPWLSSLWPCPYSVGVLPSDPTIRLHAMPPPKGFSASSPACPAACQGAEAGFISPKQSQSGRSQQEL